MHMYDYIIHKFQYMHIYTYSPKLLVCICLFFLTYKNDSLIFIRQENSVSLKQLKVIIPKLASILLKAVLDTYLKCHSKLGNA